MNEPQEPQHCPTCGGVYGRKVVPELVHLRCGDCGGTPDAGSAMDHSLMPIGFTAGPVVISPWTCDVRGYLLTPSGARAARLDNDGTLWLWDKRARCEVPFTLDDWQTCQTTIQRGEP